MGSHNAVQLHRIVCVMEETPVTGSLKDCPRGQWYSSMVSYAQGYGFSKKICIYRGKEANSEIVLCDVKRRVHLVHFFYPIGLEGVAATVKPRARTAAHIHDAGGPVLRGKCDSEVDHLGAHRIESNFFEDSHHLFHVTCVVGAVGVKL